MKRGSVIINSSSVAAYMVRLPLHALQCPLTLVSCSQGNPALVDYSSTKGAIAIFTKSLALQLADKSIRVCAVAPGIIWTPLQPATGGQAPESVKQIGVDEAPVRRPGQPSEVAAAYIWAASAEGGYCTGAVFHVNGGLDVSS